MGLKILCIILVAIVVFAVASTIANKQEYGTMSTLKRKQLQYVLIIKIYELLLGFIQYQKPKGII